MLACLCPGQDVGEEHPGRESLHPNVRASAHEALAWEDFHHSWGKDKRVYTIQTASSQRKGFILP